MKILINPIWGVEVKAFEILCKKYDIDEIYAIEFENKCRDFKKSDMSSLVKEEFMYLDMFDAKYEKYIFYDERMPLDQDLLDKMSIYEPEALKMLERAGRINDSAERRFIQYHTHVRYWNCFLGRTKVDCFITGSTPHAIYDYIIMRLCQIKGIPVIQNEPLPFQSCFKIRLYTKYEDLDQNIVDKIAFYKKKFEDNPSEKLSRRMQAEYDLFMGTNKQVFKTSPSQKGLFKARIHYFSQLWNRNKKNAVGRAIKHFTSKNDTRRLLAEYSKMTVSPDWNKKYIYFPLHYQPERSTSPIGGWYVHLYLAIEMLSYYLPKDAVIYVKEHPRMKETLPVHTRVMEHYERINSLPNVFLVPIETSTIELADNAIAIASVTGHIGFEVLFKKKPYLMFGNSILKYAPTSLNIRNNRDCEEALLRVFGNNVNVCDADIKAYLMAVDDISIEEYHEKFNSNYSKKESVKDLVSLFSEMFDQILVQEAR